MASKTIPLFEHEAAHFLRRYSLRWGEQFIVRVESIGLATLYLGDCLEIMASLPTFDAVITDPPYGTQNLAGGYGRRQLHDVGDGMGRVIANDEDLGAIEAAFPMLLQRVSKGWMAVFYAARKTPEFVQATAGGVWFGGVVWDKGMPGLGYHIRYQHEDIAIFRVGEPERPERPLLSVVRAAATGGEEHPHEKPVRLLEALVDWLAPSAGAVLDPFMGSGSTGVACLNLGRSFVGIEVEQSHFDTACKRLDLATRQTRLIA